MEVVPRIERFGMDRREAAYAACVGLFGVVLVLTNILGVKLFVLFPDGRPGWMPGEGPLTLTSGILTYPVTFFLTDLVSEFWGRKRADFMVWMGFAMSLLMLVLVQLARALPASELWQNGALDLGPEELQRSFEATFFYPGSLLFASMTAYLVSQLLDVRLYHFWWRVTKGGHMWVRNNGSTMISQLVDTAIVNSIFLRLAFDLSWGAIGEIIAAVYVCKLAMAACDTPLLYVARAALWRWFAVPHDHPAGRAPLA